MLEEEMIEEGKERGGREGGREGGRVYLVQCADNGLGVARQVSPPLRLGQVLRHRKNKRNEGGREGRREGRREGGREGGGEGGRGREGKNVQLR